MFCQPVCLLIYLLCGEALGGKCMSVLEHYAITCTNTFCENRARLFEGERQTSQLTHYPVVTTRVWSFRMCAHSVETHTRTFCRNTYEHILFFCDAHTQSKSIAVANTENYSFKLSIFTVSNDFKKCKRIHPNVITYTHMHKLLC